jgi:hypothetical protein
MVKKLEEAFAGVKAGNATDSRGGVALQSFTVSSSSINQPPVITSTPVITALTGFQYQYQVAAQDPENHALTYSLAATPPSGMSIGGSTGLILWNAPVGNPTVTVNVSDGSNIVSQTFTITVSTPGGNHAPAISSTRRQRSTGVDNGSDADRINGTGLNPLDLQGVEADCELLRPMEGIAPSRTRSSFPKALRSLQLA